MKFSVTWIRAARGLKSSTYPIGRKRRNKSGLRANRLTTETLIVRPRSGGVAYFCYEFAMYMLVDKQRYFSIGRTLYAGSIVLYAFNEAGEDVDLEDMPPVVFYNNAEQVEKAIAANVIDRPMMKADKVQLWAWPEPPRDEPTIARMREHGTWDGV
jgi:hypothetical protein